MRKITAEQRAQIVKYYLEHPGTKYRDIAPKLGVSEVTIGKIIRAELQAGNGIKPDRRKVLPVVELDEAELDEKHREALKAQHPRTLNWMEHVKPLHQHKQELELRVQHKQAELDAARQELRDFTETLKKLMEDAT